MNRLKLAWKVLRGLDVVLKSSVDGLINEVATLRARAIDQDLAMRSVDRKAADYRNVLWSAAWASEHHTLRIPQDALMMAAADLSAHTDGIRRELVVVAKRGN